MAYALWEDEYRKRIATECGLKCKNDISSDVFHDLNKFRQAILHAGSRLDEETKAIHFFRKGDTVAFTENQMTELFAAIIEELNRIGNEYYNMNPGFSFKQALDRAGRPNFL